MVLLTAIGYKLERVGENDINHPIQ